MQGYLIAWLAFQCPFGIGKAPFVLKPLLCSGGATLEMRVVATQEAAQHVIRTLPESRDFAWCFRLDGGRLRSKPVHWIPVLER